MTDETAKPVRHETVTVIAFAVMLSAMFAKACAVPTGLVAWETDPFLDPSPTVGWTAGMMMHIDALVMFAATVVVCAGGRRANLRLLGMMILGMAACAGVSAWHTWSGGQVIVGQAKIGSAWAAAWAAACAMVSAGGLARVRALAVSAFAGFITLIVIKGVSQVLIDHPAVVQSVRENFESFARAQGWEPDSSLARSYLRRAMDPEASAWFSMSNVFSSVCAAGVGLGLGLVASGTRIRHAERAAPLTTSEPTRPLGPLAIGSGIAMLLIGAAGVALGGGKGGGVAVGIVLATFGAFFVLARSVSANEGDRRRRLTALAGMIVPCLALAAVAAVIVRGIIGLRIGEKSILFRSQYVEAALRIFSANPLSGVGPDGFKDAYLLAKNPLNPEDVASPHSIFFDWAACLGVAGALLGAVFIIMLAFVGLGAIRARLDVPPADGPGDVAHPLDTRLALLIPCGAVIAGLFAQREGLTPATALMTVIGLAAWCLAASIVRRIALRNTAWIIGLAAAAAGLAAHAQIEVTLSWVNSAAIVLAFISLAAAQGAPGRDIEAPAKRTGRRPVAFGALGLPIGAAALLSLTLAIQIRVYEGRLERTAEPARAVGQARLTLDRVARDRAAGRSTDPQLLTETADLLAKQLNRAVAATPEAILAAASDAEAFARESAFFFLPRNASDGPYDWRTIRERSRIALAIYMTALTFPESRREPLTDKRRNDLFEAMLPPIAASDRGPGLAPRLAWQASVMRALLEIEPRAGLTPSVKPADLIETLNRAMTVDPWNAQTAASLARAMATHAAALKFTPAQVAAAAKKALEIDDLTSKLDPEGRALPDRERRDLQRLAGLAQ